MAAVLIPIDWKLDRVMHSLRYTGDVDPSLAIDLGMEEEELQGMVRYAAIELGFPYDWYGRVLH